MDEVRTRNLVRFLGLDLQGNSSAGQHQIADRLGRPPVLGAVTSVRQRPWLRPILLRSPSLVYCSGLGPLARSLFPRLVKGYATT